MTLIAKARQSDGKAAGGDSRPPDGSEEGASMGGLAQLGHPFVHSQVRRIREEDLRIGDGTGEGDLSAMDRDHRIMLFHLGKQVDAILCSRPSPPASPLGHKTAVIKSLDSGWEAHA